MEYEKVKERVEKRITKRDESLYNGFSVSKVIRTPDKVVRTSYLFDADKISTQAGVSDIVTDLKSMDDSELRGELKKETLKELRAYARQSIE